LAIGNKSLARSLSQKIEQGEREEGAIEKADNDFGSAVADSFFQTGVFFDVQMQILHQHIQIATLVAQIHSYSQGVVQNDHRQSQGDGESSAGQTFQITDGDDHRNGKSAVGGRHMAVSEKIFPLEAVFGHKNDKLGGLRDDTHDNRYKRNKQGIEIDVHWFFCLIFMAFKNSLAEE